MTESNNICLFNIKNGTGKTTLAYTLARQLDYSYTEAVYKYKEKKRSDIDEKKVYDINSDDKRIHESIIKKCNRVVIPTSLDYKDLFDTKLSIEKAKEYNNKIKIIVAFNRLNTSHKKAEETFTQESINFLKRDNNITFSCTYIRDNKLWYLNFFDDKFYLDIIEKESFHHLMCNDEIFSSFFTNNRILEYMYQYSYYYSPLYLNMNRYKKKDKNKQPIDETLRTDEYIDSFIKAKNQYSNNKMQVANRKSQEKKENIESILFILEEFDRLPNQKMITYDEELYEMIQCSYLYYDIAEKTKKHTNPIKDQEIARILNSYSSYANHIENIKKRFSIEAEKKTESLKEDDDLKFEMQEYRILREDITYTYLQSLFNLKVVKNNRKILRDMRNLLILLGEY